MPETLLYCQKCGVYRMHIVFGSRTFCYGCNDWGRIQDKQAPIVTERNWGKPERRV